MTRTKNTNARCFKVPAGLSLFAVLEAEDASVLGLVLAPNETVARELYTDDTEDADEREMVDGWFEEGQLVVQHINNRVVAPHGVSITLK